MGKTVMFSLLDFSKPPFDLLHHLLSLISCDGNKIVFRGKNDMSRLGGVYFDCFHKQKATPSLPGENR